MKIELLIISPPLAPKNPEIVYIIIKFMYWISNIHFKSAISFIPNPNANKNNPIRLVAPHPLSPSPNVKIELPIMIKIMPIWIKMYPPYLSVYLPARIRIILVKREKE